MTVFSKTYTFRAGVVIFLTLLVYIPAMCFVLSAPLFFMGGLVRPGLSAVLIVFGGYLLWQRNREGWVLRENGSHFAQMEEELGRFLHFDNGEQA